MKRSFVLEQCIRFWQMSSQFNLSQKQEIFQTILDPKLTSQFSAKNIETENYELIQKVLLDFFDYFNKVQANEQRKIPKIQMIDNFLHDKMMSQIQILNQNNIFLQFPQKVSNIQIFGDLQVFGLNLNRDENKYIHDYKMIRKENKLFFEQKVHEEHKIKQKSNVIQEGMFEIAKQETQQLPFLNRQAEKVFKLFGRKYEPPELELFTDDLANKYSILKKKITNTIEDHLIIEDYLVNTEQLKIDQNKTQVQDFYFIIRTERAIFGKQAQSVKKFQNFMITDLDFLCGGNPPSYLKSYLN